jgi:ElaA protein
MSGAELPAIGFRWYRWSELDVDTLYAALRLRSDIFVVEQNCVFLDLDNYDQASEHLIARDGDGQVRGCARLLPPGLKYIEPSIGRVVIDRSLRRGGFGRALMGAAIDGCDARFPDRAIVIGAQQRLERFYADFGFVAIAEPYLEDGIWHVDMRRA